MSDTTLRQVERDLIRMLNEEYSFYQSLYILLDKQRDLIKYNRDDNLLDLFSEVERFRVRIKDSEQKIADLRVKYPSAFKLAADNQEIRKLVTCIATLVRKSLDVVTENSAYIQDRHERLQQELQELQSSDKMLQYLRNVTTSPQYVDRSE